MASSFVHYASLKKKEKRKKEKNEKGNDNRGAIAPFPPFINVSLVSWPESNIPDNMS